MRSLAAGVAGVLAFLLLVGQALAQELPLSPAQRAWLQDHPTVTVAVYKQGWPPFEEWNDGMPRGLSVDLLNEALARLGVTPQYQLFDSWPKMIQATCDGRVDMVMNISITAERTECMVFSREYAQVPIALVSRLDDVRPTLSTDLRGLHIVTERGFSTGEAARARYPQATHMYVDTTQQALQAVADGTADIYVGNAYVAADLMQANHLSGIGLVRVSALPNYPLHFAVPNANRSLAESINTAMQAIPQTRRETLELKWLPDLRWVNEHDSIFSADEQAALNRQLIVGFPPNAPPISFSDDQGRPAGLLADYLQRFQEMGAKVVPFPAKNWQAVRDAMREGSVDAVVMVVDPLDTRREWVHSQPIVTIPNVIVTRSDAKASILELRDLSSRTIAVVDPERLERMVAKAARGATFVHATDSTQGLELVRSRKVDAYVGNLAVVDALIRERFIGELRVAAPAGVDDSFVFAAPKKDALLVSAFDRMLASMSPRERAAIRSDWLAVEYNGGTNWRRILRWVIPILVALVVVVLVHARGYRRLRLEVEQRRVVEKRLSEVTDNLPAVVYQASVSAPGRVRFPFVVGDLPSMFGITAEEAMADGNALMDRIEPADRERLRAIVERVMSTHESVDVQFQVHASDGWRWIRSHSLPYQAEDQRWHWTGYWVDVTDQHRQWEDLLAAKAAAEGAARAKSDFLATMSHEIRTPMSGVVGLLEMLSYTSLDDEQKKIVATIEDSALMLRQILDDILDFSKMEAGALTLDARPFGLRGTVQSVIRMLEPLSGEKNLLVEASFDPGVAQGHIGDDVRLRQILFNLLSNAIKFTDQGSVEVSVHVLEQNEGKQKLALTVIDTGIGIAKERQDKLFQPFSQAEASTSRRFGGTGLGLSICHRIVTLMGGAISLHSEVGEGTEVLVELELPVTSAVVTEGEHAKERAPARVAALAGGNSVRVLIAEDHPTNRTLMAWYMQQLGLAYDMVEDGSQALAALDERSYDLLITDGVMPVMNGYELAMEVRHREAATGGQRLPIIAITASAYKDEIDLWKESGMDAYLAKPISLTTLAKTVSRWLQAGGAAASLSMAPEPAIDPAVANGFEQDVLPAVIRQYGSLRVAVEMLKSFAQTTRGDIERVRALDDDARLEVASVMHHLAGGLYTIVQPTLGEQAKELETRLRSSSDPVRTDVLAFVARLESLVDMIDERVASTAQTGGTDPAST